MNDTLQYCIDLFNNNPILNAVSLFLAILGIIFTAYFYFKSKKNKVPIYIIRTINQIKERIQKIESVDILYSGQKINNLSVSKIALWNDGKETIDNKDIAINDPIKLAITNDYEFLNAEILYQKNDANDFKLTISDDNKFINITFDYFDFEEGIVLQVFHTGDNSEDIHMVGKIKSVNRINRKDVNNSLFSNFILRMLKKDKKRIGSRVMRLIMGWTVLITGCLFAFMALTIPFLNDVPKNPNPSNDKTAFLFVVGIGGIIYILMGYNMLKRSIPNGFNVFNEEF